MNRLSARNKLLLAMVVILLLSFVGVSFLNYKRRQNSLQFYGNLT